MQELKECGMNEKEISKKLDEFEQDFTQTKRPKSVSEKESLISFDKESKKVNVDKEQQKRIPKARRIIDEKC